MLIVLASDSDPEHDPVPNVRTMIRIRPKRSGVNRLRIRNTGGLGRWKKSKLRNEKKVILGIFYCDDPLYGPGDRQKNPVIQGNRFYIESPCLKNRSF
jgi:hypothetical protein